MDERMQDVKYLVKGAVPASAVGLLWGGSGSFKTFLAIDLALSLCYGLPYLGLKTARTNVLYMAFEGGLGVANRIKAWHVARGMDWRKCPMKVVIDPLALRQDAALVAKALEVAGFLPGLVVADTFSQTYSGDENDAAEVSSFIRALVAAFVSKFGATVMLVHHAGHSNTERPRGSSALIANADFVFGVFRSEGAQLATLECSKQKDGSLLPPVAFRLDLVKLGEDSDGDPITSLSAHHIADPKALADTVGTGPEGPKKALIDIARLGLPVGEARKKFYAESDAETLAAKKKQWQRTLTWAEQSGIVQIADGLLRRVTV
jgi:hypothetical protein